MSVDIDWHTLTDGPDGEALARTIRDFIHERIQQVPFPRLIRSVNARSFEFGTVAPSIVIKDICNPLPDFYEDDEDEQDTPATDDEPTQEATKRLPRRGPLNALSVNRDRLHEDVSELVSPTLSRAGVLGPGSNIGYFHLPLSAGLSGGRATPLAAVAGGSLQVGAGASLPQHHRTESFNSITPPSSAAPSTRPASRDANDLDGSAAIDDTGTETGLPQYETSPEDFQVVFHVTYAGDVRLALTAEVFLDYPMPSFVGIPLKLNITGLTFNGVGIVAYIKKKAHVCFLSPEDAEALVGGTSGLEENTDETTPDSDDKNARPRVGALIEDIRIETEMGETEEGKQVLKNVGKIEKFVLEQVRRIFEDEFVYPSFWTFLV